MKKNKNNDRQSTRRYVSTSGVSFTGHGVIKKSLVWKVHNFLLEHDQPKDCIPPMQISAGATSCGQDTNRYCPMGVCAADLKSCCYSGVPFQGHDSFYYCHDPFIQPCLGSTGNIPSCDPTCSLGKCCSGSPFAFCCMSQEKCGIASCYPPSFP